MKRMILLCLIPFVFLGCETIKEVRTAPKTATFVQALAYTQGQIGQLRDMTAFYININNEDCVARPNTDLCDAAAKINQGTREYRDKIDLIYQSYSQVKNLKDCSIQYEGVTLPCEDTQDQVLSGLLKLQALLPKGDKP